MFQTIVVSVAAAAGVGILGLLIWSAHQARANLERRIQDAETGGRPLSIDERAWLQVFGRQPGPESDNALTRTQVLAGVLLLSYLVVFALVVALLGFPLGFITMFVLGQVLAGLYALHRRRSI